MCASCSDFLPLIFDVINNQTKVTKINGNVTSPMQ